MGSGDWSKDRVDRVVSGMVEVAIARLAEIQRCASLLVG
jgi:hypothetical protein